MAETLKSLAALAALRDKVRKVEAPKPAPVEPQRAVLEPAHTVLTAEQVRALACHHCHSWPCLCDALHIGLWSQKAQDARLRLRNVSEARNVNETYKAGLRTGERYIEGAPPVRMIALAPDTAPKRAPRAKRKAADTTCPHCGRDPCAQRTWACIRAASAKKKAPASKRKAPGAKRAKR